MLAPPDPASLNRDRRPGALRVAPVLPSPALRSVHARADVPNRIAAETDEARRVNRRRGQDISTLRAGSAIPGEAPRCAAITPHPDDISIGEKS
jgi:hypothetical protein